MALAPVVALELGTTKTVALVGEARPDGVVMITGIGEHPTTGIRKGEVTDLANAVVGARAALQAAEETSQVTIHQVHLALSGGHIQSLINRGTTPVGDPAVGITEQDVEQVMGIARAATLPPECEILHTICQRFIIDDHSAVVRPEGLEGSRLSLDMLVLYGVRARLRSTIRVVRGVPMDVQDVAFSGLCSALATLVPEQKESGVLLIDLGGGTTDYVVYANQTLAAAGSIGVGGDHVTNDISLAFSIPLRQAETIKRESGAALVDVAARSHRIAVPAEVGFPARSVNLHALQTVIHARVDETLSIIRSRLDEAGILHHVGAGVVVTGGGARMRGLPALVERTFGLPCSIGMPRDVSGLAASISGPEYATAIGMVKYGFKNAAQARPRSMMRSIMAALFGSRPTKFERNGGTEPGE